MSQEEFDVFDDDADFAGTEVNENVLAENAEEIERKRFWKYILIKL